MNGYSHQFPGVQQSSGFSNGLQSGGIGMFPPTSVVGISPSAMMIQPGAAAFSMQQSFYQVKHLKNVLFTLKAHKHGVVVDDPSVDMLENRLDKFF